MALHTSAGADGTPAFVEVDAPSDDELHALLQSVITRLLKMLTRRGVLVEDMGQSYLAEPDADGEDAGTLRPLQAAAITYRIAFGPRAGQKVLTLRGSKSRPEEPWGEWRGGLAVRIGTAATILMPQISRPDGSRPGRRALRGRLKFPGADAREMAAAVARAVGHGVRPVHLPIWMLSKVVRQQGIDP